MNLIRKINISHKLFPAFFLLFLLMTLLSSCLNHHREKMHDVLADENNKSHFRIHEIQERGKLIATTDFNSTDYFIYRGEPMGFQYGKLKMFAEYLGVELEIKVSDNLDEAFKSLDQGESDLIAMGLTVTLDRTRKFDFSSPILQTRQMLVQRKPANWRKMRTWNDIEDQLVRNPIDLAGKTVVVQKTSAYSDRLENLSEEIGWPILIEEDPVREVEQLVEAVANGEIEYTV